MNHFTSALTALAATLALAACGSSKESAKTNYKPVDVPYTVARNYFVNSRVQDIYTPWIADAQTFNGLFGMAATMGRDGQPTPIDFNKQSVIAIIKPETNRRGDIRPVSFRAISPTKLLLTYTYDPRDTLTYTLRPSLIVIYDKRPGTSVEVADVTGKLNESKRNRKKRERKLMEEDVTVEQ